MDLSNIQIEIQQSYNQLFKEDFSEIEFDGIIYKKSTFDKSKRFLLKIAKIFWDIYHINLLTPSIFPSIDGSFNIEWKNNKFQLLIIIPQDDKEMIGLYGDNYENDNISKEFYIDESDFEFLKWLKKYHS